MSGMESSWKPTAYLRWEMKRECGKHIGDGIYETIMSKVLMQKWIYMDGSEEWREVPECG
jgi:hypothetical protein